MFWRKTKQRREVVGEDLGRSLSHGPSQAPGPDFSGPSHFPINAHLCVSQHVLSFWLLSPKWVWRHHVRYFRVQLLGTEWRPGVFCLCEWNLRSTLFSHMENVPSTCSLWGTCPSFSGKLVANSKVVTELSCHYFSPKHQITHRTARFLNY